MHRQQGVNYLLILLSTVALAVDSVPTTSNSSSPGGILSRKRRFTFDSDFLDSTTFKVTFAFAFPVGDFTLTSSLPITYTFGTGILSRETVGPAGSANGRSLRSSETIYSILNTAEEYITRLGGGINGRACVLRAICEIAQNPEHEDGFLGEVANLVVNGNHGRGLTSFFHRGGSSNVYQNAYSKGSYEKNCAEFYEGCAISFFDFVDLKERNRLASLYDGIDPSLNSIDGHY